MTTPKTLAIAAATALTLGGFGQAALASTEAALSLSVRTPAGKSLPLAYRAGDGWKSSAGKDAGPASKVASTKAATAAAQPLAVFLDKPTGFTYVYLPEQGWKFAGHSDVAKPMKVALTNTDASMAMFVDGPTGFTFTYTADDGWKYVGRVGDMKL